MKLSHSLVLAASASVALAAPSQHWTRQHKIFERSVAPEHSGWTFRSAPHPASMIDLKIALREQGDIASHLYEVSDPSHERYGQHLTKEQVDELTRASPTTQSLVYSWLKSHGIHAANLDSNWVNIRVPVGVAETLLNAQYGMYEDAAGARILRTEAYSLPEMLHDHIDVVAPTTYFGLGKRTSNTIIQLDAADNSTSDLIPFPYETPEIAYNGLCNSTNVTLACLAHHYGYEGYESKAADKNPGYGVTAYLGEHENEADLHQFLQTFRPEAAGFNYTVELVNNGTNPQDYESEGEGEAALDVQWATGIAYPAKGYFYSTVGIPPFQPDAIEDTASNDAGVGNEDYLTWLQYVLKQDNPPAVITTSYDDDEQTVPFNYASRVCNEFSKLGARGITLLFSSGDFGPGGVQKSNCTVNDGTGRKAFIPNFPSSCPAVTSVGGVENFVNETVVLFGNKGGSGGGFSNYFSQPAYQKTAVNGYLKKIGDLNEGLFNPKGRAFPDIAFNGRNYSIVFGGNYTRISGTSASSPGLAGFLTLVNDARLAAGKSVLGFLNPLLYSDKLDHTTAFRDTVLGSNYAISPGCNTSGFPALPGWDAATGFGSPIFKGWVDQLA